MTEAIEAKTAQVKANLMFFFFLGPTASLSVAAEAIVDRRPG